VAAVTVAGLIAGASLTFGQSSPGRVVNACVKAKSGAVRISRGNRCRRGERRLTWNIRGRAGPPGAGGSAGPSGPRGEGGDKGSPGSFGFDDFHGMPCSRPGGDGTTELSYDSQGFARFQC
jgi:hypothetical protein